MLCDFAAQQVCIGVVGPMHATSGTRGAPATSRARVAVGDGFVEFLPLPVGARAGHQGVHIAELNLSDRIKIGDRQLVVAARISCQTSCQPRDDVVRLQCECRVSLPDRIRGFRGNFIL